MYSPALDYQTICWCLLFIGFCVIFLCCENETWGIPYFLDYKSFLYMKLCGKKVIMLTNRLFSSWPLYKLLLSTLMQKPWRYGRWQERNFKYMVGLSVDRFGSRTQGRNFVEAFPMKRRKMWTCERSEFSTVKLEIKPSFLRCYPPGCLIFWVLILSEMGLQFYMWSGFSSNIPHHLADFLLIWFTIYLTSYLSDFLLIWFRTYLIFYLVYFLVIRFPTYFISKLSTFLITVRASITWTSFHSAEEPFCAL